MDINFQLLRVHKKEWDYLLYGKSGFPGGASGKEPACLCRRHGFDPLGQEEPLEKEMATHSSILAWRIPWTEEPGRLRRGAKSQTQLSIA